MPNMYARGILFGKMVLELGDTCIAKNEKHGMYCDLDFKTKVIGHLCSPHLYLLNPPFQGILFRDIQCVNWADTSEFHRCW